MDVRTVGAYDGSAAAYATEWEQQPPPADLYRLVKQFFRPGRTADIGCGSGRDTAWLAENGFPAVGYDASLGLLAEARRRHPDVPFEDAALPGLGGIADGSFTNVLCETVIMHLNLSSIDMAVQRLVSIAETDGTVYVSWRIIDSADRRDHKGRLYTAFDPTLVTDAMYGTKVLYSAQDRSASSGNLIYRVIARRL